MEENFSMEWNMVWKIFSMEWKWNGKKLPVWNMEKSFSILFHTIVITLVFKVVDQPIFGHLLTHLL